MAQTNNLFGSLFFSALDWARDSFVSAFAYTNSVWQFQNDFNAWVTYGQVSSKGYEDFVTPISSDDIEKHYTTDQDKTPILLQSQKYQYVMDFNSMTQTNQQTKKSRPIRRSPATFRTRASNTSVGSHEWFFKNNQNWWIKYGQANSEEKTSRSSITTSKEIESHLLKSPREPLIISNGKFQYTLDFNKMTQTNSSTKTVRPIIRLYVVSTSTGAAKFTTSVASPSFWTLLFKKTTIKYAIQLNAACTEFDEQILFIKKTFPGCNVKNLYRVENKYLRIAYENRKDLLAEEFPGICFKETYFFHGTSSNNVQSICSENLDWRLHGSSTGQLYGRGTYFSNSAKESSQYCTGSWTKTMFIVKVLVGHITEGNPSMVKPPKDFYGQPYDTTVDDVNNPTIFVKYDNQDYYPVYYFEFSGG